VALLPVVMLLICTIMFGLTRLSGDPAALMLPPNASLAEIAALRQQLGLTAPLGVQYAVFLRGVLRGDFGKSLYYRQPALSIVLERLPASGELALTALAVSIVVGASAGIISAVRQGTILDELTMVGALLGQAMPTFWLGLMLILVFSVQLGWFPPSGRGGVQSLVLPAVSLGAYSAAGLSRMVRSGMLEIMSREFIRTARAKGLRESSVIFTHALKNAAIPTVTLIGLQLGVLFGGAVVTETIFAWPGVGRLLTQAIFARDFPLVSAATFVVASVFVLSNFLVDLTYLFLNPRMRYQ